MEKQAFISLGTSWVGRGNVVLALGLIKNQVKFVLDILSLSFLQHTHLMEMSLPRYSLLSGYPQHPAMFSQLCLGTPTPIFH